MQITFFTSFFILIYFNRFNYTILLSHFALLFFFIILIIGFLLNKYNNNDNNNKNKKNVYKKMTLIPKSILNSIYTLYIYEFRNEYSS